MDIESLKKELKSYLIDDEKRYNHCIGVMKMSGELAKIYGVDVGKAEKCGLMHDMAKRMKEEELIKYCEDNNIEISNIERLIPKILHGKVGGDICYKKYDFDEEMKNSIVYHTTGRPNMSILEQIVYVADKIDETRTYSDVEYYRDLARKDIDEATIEILDFGISDFVKKRKIFSPVTVETRNCFLNKKAKEEKKGD